MKIQPAISLLLYLPCFTHIWEGPNQKHRPPFHGWPQPPQQTTLEICILTRLSFRRSESQFVIDTYPAKHRAEGICSWYSTSTSRLDALISTGDTVEGLDRELLLIPRTSQAVGQRPSTCLAPCRLGVTSVESLLLKQSQPQWHSPGNGARTGHIFRAQGNILNTDPLPRILDYNWRKSWEIIGMNLRSHDLIKWSNLLQHMPVFLT